jgi:hypothetical protein
MDAPRLPAAVLAAAGDRRGGAMEVAATALDGLLEIAADPPLLEQAVATLVAGQPAMAPIWHLAKAARDPDPRSALADLRRRLDNDADAAVATATAWLRRRLDATPARKAGATGGADQGAVATVSHSSLVARVLAAAGLTPAPYPGSEPPAAAAQDPGARANAPVRRRAPRRGSVADRGSGRAPLSTAPFVAVVGADAIGPEAFLNAAWTGELAARLPTLVVATPVKLVPAEAFERLGGPGFEVVPLAAVTAVVVGPEALSPAEAGRRAGMLSRGRP